ncbi:MAG: copper transporter, partial [bacterium]
MISLRYHLLSLVSVFLALAIGILIGSAFVMRADLRSISQRLQKEFSEVREEVRKERETSRQIEAILGNYRRFAQSVIPLLVRGRLAGQRIGIIYIGNVEDKVISELEETIEAAGGQVSFLISLLPSQIRNLSEGYEEFFVSLSNDLLWGNKRGLEYLAGQNLINIKSWQGTTTK